MVRELKNKEIKILTFTDSIVTKLKEFKALLFICAGVVIHSIKDSQDIRFIGNISFQIPFTSTCLIISNFAL